MTQGHPGAIQPAAPAALAGETVLFEGQPALVHSLGAMLLAIFTLGIAVLFFWFKRGGITYRVTTQRIVVDKGILSKKMEQLDLYRINDFTIERPFGQRIMGTGNLRLTTFDKSTPIVELSGLKTDVVQLYETLRVAVEASKQHRGVRMIDYEQGS
ncbi:MAG: PH domain-containing protein [Polyangiaceae bacterium]|nr:PH domain-containing protein [Polyangiaceae bacterium]